MGAQEDLDTLPGKTGTGISIARGVRVYDVGAVATAEIPVLEITLSPNAQSVWLSFMADAVFYIIVGDVGSVAAPDPAAREDPAVTPNAQCIRIPADYEWMRKFNKTRGAFRMVAPDAPAVVRVERVSVPFGRPVTGA